MTEKEVRKQAKAMADDSHIWGYFLKYKDAYYQAECVEVTKDTAYFQVDPSVVRKGLFPRSRLSLNQLKEMNIELYPVFYPPIEEQ